uniref:LRRNT domain-containing protein n=1 Tax=Heliothis virescens TaxID=7102 RepID=A0A2A4JTC0_HELVI
MVRLPLLLRVLLLISVAKAEGDFDEGLGDLCYSCVCSADKTIVDCSHRGLTDLLDGSGSQVTMLNISNNEISTFPKNLHKFYNLVMLDLSGNRLNELPKDALQNLTALEDLNLSHNYFISWLFLNPNEAFLSASSLKKLDLSYNKFSTMGNLANQELIISPTLETLKLEQCEIDSIYGRSPLSGLSNIKYLKLNFNPITRIQGLISSTLKSLDVSNCALSRRLAAIQAERERQVEEARDRLRQLRMRAEQEALCNTPDPRDLIAPPSYDEALSMPKLNVSCHSLNETGTGKTRRKRGRRKTKSSGDLLEETERNGDVRVLDDVELSETPNDRRRRPRRQISRYGSHEVAELDQSPGARRRRMSEYNADYDSQNDDNVTVEVQAELERPLRPRPRRYSNGDNNLRESDF